MREPGQSGFFSSKKEFIMANGKPVNQLAHLRNIAGLTQQGLADKAGIHLGQVQKIEYGQRKISGVSFRIGIALADALGVDPHELLDDDIKSKV